MTDKPKPQPSAAAESADTALHHIVDGFLHFHHEIFPEQEAFLKKLPRRKTRVRCLSPAPIRELCRS